MSEEAKKVALITGSATGVGRACAIKFAQLGFNIVVNCLGRENEAQEPIALVKAEGAEALLVQCDVSQNAQVVEMVRQVEDRYGRLDVVVNSAGTTYFVDHPDLEGMSEEKWDDIFAVNTKGPFFVIRAAIPLLQKAGGAAVVNISSAAGISGDGSSIAYCASKGALNTMTKSLAKAFAPGVRVNAVCPGTIHTRATDLHISSAGLDPKEALVDFGQSSLMKRVGQPSEIASGALFLASDEASFMTGAHIVIDGGATID